jgi:sulfide:quinone oxidoreductase
VERTLVLGGGFGGIAVATGLRERLGDAHEVLLVDRRPAFSMGLRKLWELVGLGTIEEGSRPRSALAGDGVEFVEADVTAIDPSGRAVETSAGHFQGNRLVVAIGAESRADLIPGLAAHGHDLWSFRTAPVLRRALEAFGGGRVAVVIFGVPYPCPPAPYESAMLLDDLLRRRGLRERTHLTVVTLQPMLLPNAGAEGSAWLGERLDERGITWQVDRKPDRVESGRVVFADGDLPFDLLLAVPPHRPPAVLGDGGLLSESGWIEPDRGTLATRFPGVWAVGDCTMIRLANGLPFPKAGVMAEAQGARVAAAIAAEILGHPAPAPFDGRGFCFLETGLEESALVEGAFYAEPEPAVRMRDASRAHHDEKVAFERERLSRWFGR